MGFIIAPNVWHAIVGFMQSSNRLACLKLRVSGGQVAIISAYAPHSGHSFDSRQLFFEQLGTMIDKTSANGMKVVMGDMNARLLSQLPGEEDCIGEHVLGTGRLRAELGSNRDLLLELCAAHLLAVANTFFPQAPSQLATFRNIGTEKNLPIAPSTHAQLDYLLVPVHRLAQVSHVASDPSEPLASHHYPVIASLDIAIPPRQRQVPKHKFDRVALQDDTTARHFAI